MNESRLCPFFRRNEDECDTGCEYISPYDVLVIIRHCIARYEDCSRHQVLVQRGVEASPTVNRMQTRAA